MKIEYVCRKENKGSNPIRGPGSFVVIAGGAGSRSAASASGSSAVAGIDCRVRAIEVEGLKGVLNVPTELSQNTFCDLEVLLCRDGGPAQRGTGYDVATGVADLVIALCTIKGSGDGGSGAGRSSGERMPVRAPKDAPVPRVSTATTA